MTLNLWQMTLLLFVGAGVIFPWTDDKDKWNPANAMFLFLGISGMVCLVFLIFEFIGGE